MTTKRIILILGDQLDEAHPALSDYNADTDMILMIESSFEANYVWSHKARIAIFLSAMRHYARKLSESGYAIKYIKESELSLIETIRNEITQYQATHLIFVTPGEFRLKVELESLAKESSIKLSELEDPHFYCSLDEFRAWVGSKKELRLEYHWIKRGISAKPPMFAM